MIIKQIFYEKESDSMSRLEIPTPSKSQLVVEGLYKELEHRIEASPPGPLFRILHILQ